MHSVLAMCLVDTVALRHQATYSRPFAMHITRPYPIKLLQDKHLELVYYHSKHVHALDTLFLALFHAGGGYEEMVSSQIRLLLLFLPQCLCQYGTYTKLPAECLLFSLLLLLAHLVAACKHPAIPCQAHPRSAAALWWPLPQTNHWQREHQDLFFASDPTAAGGCCPALQP